MSELWDVYTIDRKKNGKICARGEQENLLNDEFHLWVMVWIKNPETGKYLVSQRSADKDTDPLKVSDEYDYVHDLQGTSN